MSLKGIISGALSIGFPRVSGDEPLCDCHKVDRVPFSPRERG